MDEKVVEAKPVYFHDCPALGPQSRVVRAAMLSKDGNVVLGWQRVCPFCKHEATEFEPAPGVTVIGPHQYSVDMTKAIKTEGAKNEKSS